MSHICEYTADRCMTGDTCHSSAYKLSGKIYIHVKTMCRKFIFMNFDIILTSQQTFLFCAKPYEFHCSAWSVLFEISAKLHDDRGTGHIIVSTRSLWYGIIVCSKSQDLLCFICSFDSCHYISGCTCHCLLFYRQAGLSRPSCH